MSEVWFYHLERTSLDQALPELLEKTLGRGWKALVRTPAAERIEHLDGWLWSYRDDSFLPHGTDAEALAARQPTLFLIDGAEPGEVAGFARCVVLFDGGDSAQLATARRQWSAVKAQGHAVSYWKQMARGWEKQA
jgi:DNA polymerase-3 subunit chi